ncbi:hypothetical protein [Streptomyces xiaopingdaonensis]|uniref:hypothetical protein n=1 Tax=Streptomyces xiaopingdaonensis TaxID=1565415 RepID=UPI0002F63C06|nr:hypothetical protein [Streptomyces xiaopingdaonensis]
MTTLVPTAPRGRSELLAQVRLLVRLHRPALILWAAFVVAASALLWAVGGPLTDASAAAWAEYNACTSQPCAYDQDAIIRYRDAYTYSTLALLAVPAVVAAWGGSALVGREVENGTARLAWTLGISPLRWLAVKLALPAVAVGVGTGLLAVFHRLAWSAGQGRIDSATSWYSTATYYANGPVVVALALAGLALGALAGLLWRRSLAALGTAPLGLLLLWGGLHLVAPYLWPSVTRNSSLSDFLPGAGINVSQGVVDSSGGRHDLVSGCGQIYDVAPCRAAYDKLDAVGFYHDYHPASHFWPLQLASTALLLIVAALLALAAFRLLKRRTASTRPEVRIAA